MRLAVVLNRNARRVARSPELTREVERAAARVGAPCFATRSLAELADASAEIHARSCDAVALVGGDGTFMAGLTALWRAGGGRPLPSVALVAGGTVARVAETLGALGPAGAAIERIGLRRARPARSQSLRVTLALGDRTEERLGFIFGTGLVAGFFDVYNERGAQGVASAAAIAGRVFVESFYGGAFARRVLEPLPCRLRADGAPLQPAAWSLVACSVVRDLGLHLLVTYRAGEDPRRLHLVASPLSTRALGPRAGRVLAGRSIGGPDHFDDLVEAFELEFPADAHPRGGAFVLDGDVLRARSVRVTPGPELSLLR